MPCISETDDQVINRLKKEIKSKDILINKYLAALCAIFNELKRNNLFDEILVRASKNGVVDIKSIYIEHKKIDKERLNNELKKYSIDELAVIKEILEKKEYLYNGNEIN